MSGAQKLGTGVQTYKASAQQAESAGQQFQDQLLLYTEFQTNTIYTSHKNKKAVIKQPEAKISMWVFDTGSHAHQSGLKFLIQR